MGENCVSASQQRLTELREKLCVRLLPGWLNEFRDLYKPPGKMHIVPELKEHSKSGVTKKFDHGNVGFDTFEELRESLQGYTDWTIEEVPSERWEGVKESAFSFEQMETALGRKLVEIGVKDGDLTVCTG